MKPDVTPAAVAAQMRFVRTALAPVETLTIHEARDIAAAIYHGARRLADSNGVLMPDDELLGNLEDAKQCLVEFEARWEQIR